MNFDHDIKRRDTPAIAYTLLSKFGITAPDTITMWIADGDFETAPCVNDALRRAVEHGAYSYGYDAEAYRAACVWWMQTRHNWTIKPEWVLPAQGLGHAIGTAIDLWSAPGEGVCYFTPVYHEFRNKTERAHRTPVELPMQLVDGRYELDFDAAREAITPDTRILLFCSPQNPSGRVWSADEQRAVADFAAEHDLILISDEVHNDLMYEGSHIPMDTAAPKHRNRIVTLHAASKAFNLAGLRVGQFIIRDETLRAQVQDRMTAMNYDPTTLGVLATTAAFSAEGATWLDAQMAYLQTNRDIFDAGLNAIPGVRSMPLQSTFLPWVDFSGTGMSSDEITRRLHQDARVASAPGPQFGTGGESFQRFNLTMPKARIEEAVARIQQAFSDLQ